MSVTNDLGFYDPQLYANVALISLRKRLGLANCVYRGYDKTPQERGSVINIKGPSSFDATQVDTDTGGTTAPLNTRKVQIELDQWWEVKYAVSDKDINAASQEIITTHAPNAAYAIADKIDLTLAALINRVPWYDAWSGEIGVPDVMKAHTRLFNNQVPMFNADDLFFMLDGEKQGSLLALPAFAQYQGAGTTGENTQISGYIGQRYGMNFFANQNTPSLTSGTATGLTAAIDNASGYKRGETRIHVDGLTASDTFKAGDVLKITGDDQLYAIAKDVTVSGTESDFEISPALAHDVADDAVVTFTLVAGSGGTKKQCVAFHRNAFALAMAPLPTYEGLNTRFGIAMDDVTGLALRTRLWYDGDRSTLKFGVDALWGVQILDPNLATRMI